MMGDLDEFQFEAEETGNEAFLFNLLAQSALVKKVIEAQLGVDEIRFLLDEMLREIGIKG